MMEFNVMLWYEWGRERVEGGDFFFFKKMYFNKFFLK